MLEAKLKNQLDESKVDIDSLRIEKITMVQKLIKTQENELLHDQVKFNVQNDGSLVLVASILRIEDNDKDINVLSANKVCLDLRND